MKDYSTIFSRHEQVYKSSCAASGMELLLKLHSFVAPNYREIQDKYGDTNIGFGKLSDLQLWGIHAEANDEPGDMAFEAIEAEVKSGRFPLLSLYDDRVGSWHVWIAVPEGEHFSLYSRGYQVDQPLRIANIDDARASLESSRGGRANYVRYLIVPAESSTISN